MINHYFLVFLLIFSEQIFGQITVFESNEASYSCFRIPAIIETKNGNLIAFAEGRKNSCSDFGDVDIVVKKSNNEGKTWSAINVLVDNGKLQAGNPAPIFDKMDPNYPNGRLFLFYNTGNASENDIVNGRGLREVFYIVSTDFGQNWSNPINITTSTHRPNHPKLNPKYDFAEDWRHFANTPGHGIQLTNGRLFVPTNYSKGELLNGKINYHSSAFYSDDHGQTFQISESLTLQGSNEATAVQLSNNEILLSARDQTEKTGRRYYARSKDNGKTWYSQGIDIQLIDPVCEASITKINKSKNERIFLSHLNSEKERKNLELKQSEDGGLTWKKTLTIEAGSAAYSDLVVFHKYKLGVLYEKDNYTKIVFKLLK